MAAGSPPEGLLSSALAGTGCTGELAEAGLSATRDFGSGSPPSFATTDFAAPAKALAAGTAVGTPLGGSAATTGVSLAAAARLPFRAVSILAASFAAPSILIWVGLVR